MQYHVVIVSLFTIVIVYEPMKVLCHGYSISKYSSNAIEDGRNLTFSKDYNHEYFMNRKNTYKKCLASSASATKLSILHVEQLPTMQTTLLPNLHFDPFGRPIITAGSDHYFHKCCPSICQNLFTLFKT